MSAQVGAADAVARLLGVTPDVAAALAALAEAARREMPRALRRASRWQDARATAAVVAPERGVPAVVALPFARRPLLWLVRWSRAQRRPLRILRTELSEGFFRENARRCASFTLAGTLELIREPAADDAVFVTFPDHTVGAGNTNVAVPMFGDTLLFQVLESLLVRKHSAALYRWNGFGLDRWQAQAALALRDEQRLVAEAGWLAQGVEQTIRAAPAEYFGWSAVLHKCPRRRLRIDGVRLDVLKGFLRGWAAQVDAHSTALHEMRELVERDGPALLATAANAGLGLHARRA